MKSTRYRFEALTRQHDRSDFSSGEPALDRYLQRQAGQEQRRNVTRVFVEVEESADRTAAYYTLSATSIVSDELPRDIASRLPHYRHTPGILIGRLAVDQRFQGEGPGRFALMDALWRSARVSEEAAAFAVIVEAKNGAAVDFYQRFGFIQLPETPERLFLPLATVRTLFEYMVVTPAGTSLTGH